MQEKRFLQQNWLLSPASCRKAEAEVKHEMEAGMQTGKGGAVLVAGPLPEEARHSKQPAQGYPQNPQQRQRPRHRSAEGAGAGCWSPAASPRPQTPLESTAGRWEPAEKGAAYQALRRQLRQLVHHTVRVVQDGNAAERREGVTLPPWITPLRGCGAVQSHSWACLHPSPGQGGRKQAEPPFPYPPPLPVLGSDVGHDVLVEKLQDQGDAVGKDQMLGHVLKLGGKAKWAGERRPILGAARPRSLVARPWPSSPGRCGSV